MEAIAVEIGDDGPFGSGKESAGAEMLADQRTELERHAVAAGELQIGQRFARLGGQRARLGVAFGVERGERHETRAALRGDRIGGAVGAEEAILAIVVERDLPGDALGHADMTGERLVLGARQGEARTPLGGGEREDGGAGDGSSGDRDRDHASLHRIAMTRA